MAPTTRRPKDPMAAAEAMFGRKAAPAPAASQASAIPTTRESVTLRIDSDVLEKFQADGPGWQDRMNAALRIAAALDAPADSGTRPEDLDATNDG